MNQVEIAAQIAVGIGPALNGRTKVWIASDTNRNAYVLSIVENTVGNGVTFMTADQADELAEQLKLAAERLRGGAVRVTLPAG